MSAARGTPVVPAVLILPAGTSADPGAGVIAELKFAPRFVDQKDERKPIVLVINDQNFPVKSWIRKGFLLLPSTVCLPWRAVDLVQRRLTFLDAAFHAALK